MKWATKNRRNTSAHCFNDNDRSVTKQYQATDDTIQTRFVSKDPRQDKKRTVNVSFHADKSFPRYRSVSYIDKL